MSGHVILIGLSGSGKSSVGSLLAARLGRPCYDTDQIVAERTGRPVPELMREDEREFRDVEEEVVCAVCGAPPGVVATGGGAILSERSRVELVTDNLVVWLRAPAAMLAARLQQGEDRPLLAGDPARRLQQLSIERGDLYASTAHRTVETADLTPGQVADRILDFVAVWSPSGERHSAVSSR